MGSKLEHWFLLTKIAVVVLDMMIEDGILVVDLVACWRWDRSSTYLLKPINFPKSNFQSGSDCGFSIHQKSLPIAQNSSNRQSFIR
jgi:hypothetical protein